MSRIGTFMTLYVGVDQDEYEDITGNRYESEKEARQALYQSVKWSLEEGVGGWCDLGKNAEAIVSEEPEPVWVNVYVLERCYGGPEEGGWYYEAGYPYLWVDVSEMNEDARIELADALERAYPNEGKRSSVLYGKGGYDYQVVIEDHEARQWPEEAPRYE